MADIKIESGVWKAMWFPKKASTAYSPNSLHHLTTGAVAPANASTGAEHFPVAGVYQGPQIAASSTTTDLIRVLVPIGQAQIRATGVSGTLQTASLGSQMDMYDQQVVEAGLSVTGPLTCTKYISATEGIFTIGKSVYANVA